MMQTLKYQPLAAAMVIPGCNSGAQHRGSNGGITICRREFGNITDDCGDQYNVRACDDNSLFKLYNQSDIILSDRQTGCQKLTGTALLNKIQDDYSH
jgi:hypothetical protein